MWALLLFELILMQKIFALDVAIAKMFNYFNESSVRLAVNLAEKSLKEKFAIELLS